MASYFDNMSKVGGTGLSDLLSNSLDSSATSASNVNGFNNFGLNAGTASTAGLTPVADVGAALADQNLTNNTGWFDQISDYLGGLTGEGGALSSLNLFGGTDADGAKVNGSLGTLGSLASAGYGIYSGMQANKLAEKSFALNSAATKANINNQVTTVNGSIADKYDRDYSMGTDAEKAAMQDRNSYLADRSVSGI